MHETPVGIKENALQFSMLVIINLFVGAMVGLERTVLPLIGEKQFGLVSASAALSFIITFGFSKAVLNLFAGRLADRYGRKRILLVGWGIGLFVPLLVIAANSWWVIIAANIFLGINQALAWSMTVNMKLDLVKDGQRGLAIGLNEAAGYVGLSTAALLSGYVAARYGLRPEPFYFGLIFAGFGFVMSLAVTNTNQKIIKQHSQPAIELSAKEIFMRTTWKDKTLSSSCFAGWATNLKDGMAWGLFPILFIQQDLALQEIGFLVGAYPVSWGIFQLATGSLSDRIGRKPLIVAGMFIQAGALWWILVSESLVMWLTGAILLGLGTAMVYPTLQAAISDVTDPEWRASSMGVYRFWRDSGYAFGALFAGIITDWLSVHWAIGLVSLLPLMAGLNVAARSRQRRAVHG